MVAQCLHKVGNGRCFLTNRYINTIYWLALLVKVFLINDCINSNGCFTCLTVANDKLTLATSDRNH